MPGLRWSESDVAAYEQRQARAKGGAQVEAAAEKRSKFGNKKKEVNGVVFDSTKEARRYVDLLNWQQSGQIRELRHQHEFPITVNEVAICSYVADFTYLKDGDFIVEDTKSKITRKLPVYRLKLKLMLAVYGITIQEV